MKKPSVTPRDIPRELGNDEMFFTTTDERGIIIAGNEVFTRISGYAADELIGSPHNIVRHPDMPRAAFRLVWRYLKQGRRTAAFVKNLAKDGCYYWVVAVFAPTQGGYVSVRFKPTGAYLDWIAPTYAAMVRRETEQQAKSVGAESVMDASEALLLETLKGRGFPDYDTFMRVALCEELKCRDSVLAATGKAIVVPLPALESGSDPALGHLSSIHRRNLETYSKLSSLFLKIDAFVALQRTLEEKAAFVNDLTTELRVAAMNASLSATRAGDLAKSLGVVSAQLGQASLDISRAVALLVKGILAVADGLRSVVFTLGASRLQIEMNLSFLRELIVNADHNPSTLQSIRSVQHAFRHSSDRTISALDDLRQRTHELVPISDRLGQQMLVLQVAQIAGVVESTRLSNAGDFTAVFADVRQLIGHASGHLTGLSDALSQLEAFIADAPQVASAIAAAATEIEHELEAASATAAPHAPASASREKDSQPAAPHLTFPAASEDQDPEQPVAVQTRAGELQPDETEVEERLQD